MKFNGDNRAGRAVAILAASQPRQCVAERRHVGEAAGRIALQRATDALVVDIAYRGTQPGHPFSVHWGECRPHTVGRLVDEQGADAAREDFRVRQRFGIASLDCRPAKVTLRLGPVSHATVSVPARP